MAMASTAPWAPRRADRPRRSLKTAAAVLLAAASGWGGGPALGQETAPDLTQIGIEALMNTEVTSVSRKPETRMEAAAAVYVITREDIRRTGATSLAEALRLAPGLQVAQIDSNKWAIGSRGFASRLSRSLLVQIDGRSVYSPLFAGVYWEVQDILLEDIERIEVIRGPGATLWGSNAVNGIVNVITRKARDTQGGVAILGGGEEERGRGVFRYGGKGARGLRYRIYGKYFDRDTAFHASTPDFDAWHLGQGGFRADLDLGEKDSVTLQGDLYGGRSGQRSAVSTYSAPFTAIVEEDAELSGGNLLGQWRRLFSDASDLSLQLYYDRTHRVEPTFEEARDTLNLDLQHRLRFSPRHELLWGFGYRWTSGDTSAVPTIRFIPEERTDYIASAFVQDEIRLIPARLVLTVGSKFEHNSYSGFETQPGMRLSFMPGERHAIWGSISRALRIPSRVEHDLELTSLLDPTTPTFIRVSGTKDFEPERLDAFEAGYRVQATDRLFLDVAAFYNDYDRLLSLEPGTPFTEASPPPSHDIVPLFIENKMAARVHGAELAFEWRPMPRWRLAGSYSYLQLNMRRADDSLDASTEGSTEGSSPRNAAALQSYLDLPRNLSLDLMLRRVGRLPAQRLDGVPGVDGYTDLDAVFRWRATTGLELSLVGRNLLRPRHAEFGGSSEIERSLQGRLAWRW
jgi:iron complex outermembrane receptor protein